MLGLWELNLVTCLIDKLLGLLFKYLLISFSPNQVFASLEVGSSLPFISFLSLYHSFSLLLLHSFSLLFLLLLLSISLQRYIYFPPLFSFFKLPLDHQREVFVDFTFHNLVLEFQGLSTIVFKNQFLWPSQSYPNELGVQISCLQPWRAIERLLLCKCSWVTLDSLFHFWESFWSTLGFL